VLRARAAHRALLQAPSRLARTRASPRHRLTITIAIAIAIAIANST
jgi:hypothetical protein